MKQEFEEAQRRDRRRLVIRLAVAIGSAVAMYFALRFLSDELARGWILALGLTAFFIVWPGLLLICEVYFQVARIREELELHRKQFGALSADLSRAVDRAEDRAPVQDGLEAVNARQ